MRLKVAPGDFVVEEQMSLALVGQGPWAVYRVHKVGLTTLDVQTRLASMLKLAREQVVFPALKDKEAVSEQFATLPASAPATIEAEGFQAQRIGFRLRPLGVADIRGNAFTLIVRDLASDEAGRLAQCLSALGQHGLPNYFDAQRFGSVDAEGGFIGKAILRRDAEAALRAYLTQPFAGDPRPVRAFKRAAAPLWPDWAAILAIAPRPSNFRSVLTYLVGHPQDYRKALNLIPQRLLSLYLAAYQSYLWNRIVSGYLIQFCVRHNIETAKLNIAGQDLHIIHTPMDEHLASGLATMRVALPSHQAAFQSSEVRDITLQVLAEEGLELADLKARILQKAYLPKGNRAIWLLPQNLTVNAPTNDKRFPGRLELLTRFVLPAGSYATLVLKAGSV
jgi:tRNA pseudouridine13 synthase